MKLRSEFIKHAIDARHLAGLTQEEASEYIGVGTSTLQKYETGEIHIHPDVVTSMAKVYRDPRLTRLYCENECPIGACEKPCAHESSIEKLLLDLLVTDDRQLPDTIKTLYEIVADGVITDVEKPALDRCMNFLEDLESRLKSLSLKVKNMEARS